MLAITIQDILWTAFTLVMMCLTVMMLAVCIHARQDVKKEYYDL